MEEERSTRSVVKSQIAVGCHRRSNIYFEGTFRVFSAMGTVSSGYHCPSYGQVTIEPQRHGRRVTWRLADNIGKECHGGYPINVWESDSPDFQQYFVCDEDVDSIEVVTMSAYPCRVHVRAEIFDSNIESLTRVVDRLASSVVNIEGRLSKLEGNGAVAESMFNGERNIERGD
ncbi:MAG: hypothetical protein AMS21_01050 [Gemmatimonas sp. SG8_38_2]|nr:MAG: hypothetical protein AMS21_01050 [Gemmatimonas sp. SG8_38_2]